MAEPTTQTPLDPPLDPPQDQDEEQRELVDSVLVEEVSIDGMCGVY